MAIYGIVRDGKVAEAFDLPASIDASDAVEVAEFLTIHRGGIAPAQDWVGLPDGTLNGATPNGDGTYTNPEVSVVQAPIVTHAEISRAFSEYAASVRRKAANLAKRGNYQQANYLISTLGG